MAKLDQGIEMETKGIVDRRDGSIGQPSCQFPFLLQSLRRRRSDLTRMLLVDSLRNIVDSLQKSAGRCYESRRSELQPRTKHALGSVFKIRSSTQLVVTGLANDLLVHLGVSLASRALAKSEYIGHRPMDVWTTKPSPISPSSIVFIETLGGKIGSGPSRRATDGT